MDEEPTKLDQIWPEVYDELRQKAHLRMRRERRNHTLDPTGLVHEVYLRFEKQGSPPWKDQREFLAYAGVAMRRILIEHARGVRAKHRWGTKKQVTLETAALP